MTARLHLLPSALPTLTTLRLRVAARRRAVTALQVELSLAEAMLAAEVAELGEAEFREAEVLRQEGSAGRARMARGSR